MTTYIKKGFFFLALGFVVIFCLRFACGYLVPSEDFAATANESYADRFLSGELSKKNYATDKINSHSMASPNSRRR